MKWIQFKKEKRYIGTKSSWDFTATTYNIKLHHKFSENFNKQLTLKELSNLAIENGTIGESLMRQLNLTNCGKDINEKIKFYLLLIVINKCCKAVYQPQLIEIVLPQKTNDTYSCNISAVGIPKPLQEFVSPIFNNRITTSLTSEIEEEKSFINILTNGSMVMTGYEKLQSVLIFVKKVTKPINGIFCNEKGYRLFNFEYEIRPSIRKK